MYQNNAVVCVKVNGRILRETGDVVTLPFGAEYSILLKNLNSVRAQFSVSVDGKDATDSTRLVVEPNSSLELERFIRGGNLQAGNRFRFIERTAAVEQHRGIGPDDGLIRVEAWKEYVVVRPVIPVSPYDVSGRPWPPGSAARPLYRSPARRHPPIRPGYPRAAAAARPQSMPQADKFGGNGRKQWKSDVGITVAGSESHQSFQSISGFTVEPQSTVIVLRLRGEIDGQLVSTPVGVSTRLTCSTCGRTGKSSSQFCDRCGTALTLI